MGGWGGGGGGGCGLQGYKTTPVRPALRPWPCPGSGAPPPDGPQDGQRILQLAPGGDLRQLEAAVGSHQQGHHDQLLVTHSVRPAQEGGGGSRGATMRRWSGAARQQGSEARARPSGRLGCERATCAATAWCRGSASSLRLPGCSVAPGASCQLRGRRAGRRAAGGPGLTCSPPGCSSVRGRPR